MKTTKKFAAAVVMMVSVLAGGLLMKAYSHCQIPCGIYDDAARLQEMAEHITTLEKSIAQITELSGADRTPQNINQLVRWINNKDQHADELSEIVTYYFMAQLIKPMEKSPDPAYDTYIKQLTTLHKIQVTAMKCKQTTDMSHITTLRQLLDAFKKMYLHEQPAAQ
jgi:nickel superoxide dismutase